MVSKQTVVKATLSVVFILSWGHYASAMYDPMLGRFASRDPIGWKSRQVSEYELVGSRTLVGLDPSGKISIAECNEVLDKFWTDSGDSIVKTCKDAKLSFQKPTCTDCENEPSNTGCKKDAGGNYNSVNVVLCANKYKQKETLLANLRHEIQIVKDICTCKKGCLIVLKESNEPLEDFCKEKACLEIRACIVGDCAGKSTVIDQATKTSPMEECVKDCAIWGVEYSPKCKKNAEDYVLLAWRKCFTPKDPLPPFPY